MSNTNDKLLSFKNAILDETKQKITEIEQEVKAYEETELEKARDDEYNRMFSYMQDQVQIIKAKHRQSITKFKLDSKRELLNFRNNLSKEVFEKAQEELLAFSNSADYSDFFAKQVSLSLADFPCETAVLQVRECDLPLAEKIMAENSHISSIESDRENVLGGFTLENRADGILLDQTFAAVLEDSKQEYFSTCNLRINF